MGSNETITFESFYGIFKIINEVEERKESPIIFIIKNIKQIP